MQRLGRLCSQALGYNATDKATPSRCWRFVCAFWSKLLSLNLSYFMFDLKRLNAVFQPILREIEPQAFRPVAHGSWRS
jgi:hypothetical protein